MLEFLILMSILAVAAFYIHDTLACGEVARSRGRELCQRAGLQWLDQSTALTSVRPVMQGGLPRLRRRYAFEVSSDGVNRQRAELSLLGRRLEWARLPEPPAPTSPPAALDRGAGGVDPPARGWG